MTLSDRLAAGLGSGAVQVILGVRGSLSGFFDQELPGRLARAGVDRPRLVVVDAAAGPSADQLRRTVLSRLTDAGRYGVIVRHGEALAEDAMGVLCGIASRGGADVFVEASDRSIERVAATAAASGRAALHEDSGCAEAFWSGRGAELRLEELVWDTARKRHLRNPGRMLELLRYFARTAGEPHSVLSVADEMTRQGHPVSDKTVKSMMRALEDAMLIERVPSWDIRARSFRRTPERIYPSAVSLASVLGPQAGLKPRRLLEILRAMRSAGCTAASPFLSVVGRDKGGRAVRGRIETDFLCTRGSSSMYVRYEEAIDPVTADRADAVRTMLRIPDLFDKVIVTEGEFAPWRTRRGVRVVSIGDFAGGRLFG